MGDSRHSGTTSADSARELRIMQVLDEYVRRQDAGEGLPVDEFLATHPDLGPELGEHLSLVEHFSSGPDRIERLIRLGMLQRTDEPGFAAALGPYRVERVIGRGGMGVVLKAYEPELRRAVALKVLHPERVHDPTAVLRFQREARAAAGVQHPNIVTIYAVGCEGAAHYIAMEYVAGPSLAEWIRRHGPPPAPTTREIFRQLLSALAVAHEAGLVHRDVKSSNILLDAPAEWGGRGSCRAGASADPLHPSAPWPLDPLVKLADFGLARVLASNTQLTLTQAVLGTPEYMSPEQARGEEVDHRTDLYSAGVVLYEMLTGQTPFRCDTPTTTLRRILDEEPRDPRELDRDVDGVLASLALWLMTKDREQRPKSSAAVLAALSAGEPVARPTRRRAWPWRGLVRGTVVLAVVVALGWFARILVTPRSQLTAAKIDTEDKSRVLVRSAYGEFDSLGGDSSDLAVASRVALVDVDGRGNELVIVGGERREASTDTLFAFTPAGSRKWSRALNTGPPAQLAWPDCPGTPRPYWTVRSLLAHDIDGRPGEEIVVAASDPLDYPTRVSVIDPRTGDIHASFWHMGVLPILSVADDYFGPGRPAIIAGGVNNKLDEFHSSTDDGPRLTEWDKVPVLMILDPNDMNGLGPPHTGGVEVPPVVPWAYAYLDLSACGVQESRTTGSRMSVPAAQRAEFLDIETRHPRAEPGPSGTGNIVARLLASDGKQWVELTLNADLTLSSVRSDDNTKTLWSLDEWRALWHPIYQRGREVGR